MMVMNPLLLLLLLHYCCSCVGYTTKTNHAAVCDVLNNRQPTLTITMNFFLL
jgi:hypothetical protein